MVGQVVAGGTAPDPVTSLRVEGRGPVTLVGPLEPELRRLGGATVSVAGGLAPSPPNALTVARYEIVLVDGARPVVGTILSRDGALWLAGTDTVRLRSVPAALEGKSGAKVWVVGRRTGSELTVQSYGLLKDP
jgi:hypothetical protein